MMYIFWGMVPPEEGPLQVPYLIFSSIAILLVFYYMLKGENGGRHSRMSKLEKKKLKMIQKERKRREKIKESPHKRVLGHAVLKQKGYDGCKLYAPDGTLIAKINAKRFHWYIKQNLATKIDDESIRLNFEPKGKGNANDDFYLSEHRNQCVCCGDDSHYTKHHVIPHEYRKHFPMNMKSYHSHDIVLLCSQCHEIYETEADKYKKELAKKFNIPMHAHTKVKDKNISRIKNGAHALKNLRNHLPQSRVLEITQELNEFLGNKDIQAHISVQDLEKIMIIQDTIDIPNVKSHGQAMVEAIAGSSVGSVELERNAYLLEDFGIAWRKHFIETMNPKYLNQYWDINRKLLRE